MLSYFVSWKFANIIKYPHRIICQVTLTVNLSNPFCCWDNEKCQVNESLFLAFVFNTRASDSAGDNTCDDRIWWCAVAKISKMVVASDWLLRSLVQCRLKRLHPVGHDHVRSLLRRMWGVWLIAAAGPASQWGSFRGEPSSRVRVFVSIPISAWSLSLAGFERSDLSYNSLRLRGASYNRTCRLHISYNPWDHPYYYTYIAYMCCLFFFQ